MKNKILAGVIALALAFSFAALRAEEAKAKKEDSKAATEMKEPMYVASCPAPCKFSVSSHDKAEVAAVIKTHAKSHHNMDMPDKDVADMIKEKGAKK
jgi:predicted small metal-binding protein